MQWYASVPGLVKVQVKVTNGGMLPEMNNG
jgi:hypothetical protein